MVDQVGLPLVVESMPVGEREVVFRLETEQGMRSYALDADAFAAQVQENVPLVLDMIPKVLLPLVEGFLFALRHGPIQKLAKLRGIDGAEFIKQAKHKDAAAIAVLTMVMFKDTKAAQVTPAGVLEPIDLTRDDFNHAYDGILRRVPEYDDLPVLTAEARAQLPAATE